MDRENKNIYQTRAFPLKNIKLENRTDAGELPKITGQAAVFNVWSEDLGGFKEKIAVGAFKKSLQESDIRALFNHDPNIVLGRNKAGTLSLAESVDGLDIEILPPDTQIARDLVTSVRRGDVSQMSFGFQTIKDLWKDNHTKRILTEAKLFDVSLVTFPAYSQTSVQARSLPCSSVKMNLLKLRLKSLRLSNPMHRRLREFENR